MSDISRLVHSLAGGRLAPNVINGKRCSKCHGVKPIDHFYRDKNRASGRHPQCSSCVQAFAREWRTRPEIIERNRDYQRNVSRQPARKRQILEYQRATLPSGITRAKTFKLKYKYGLSEERYLAILKSQDNSCATCKIPFADHKTTQVDHCHASGKIRGILCPPCNRALGQVADKVEILAALIDYLRRAEG
jgi:hypothetical protein